MCGAPPTGFVSNGLEVVKAVEDHVDTYGDLFTEDFESRAYLDDDTWTWLSAGRLRRSDVYPDDKYEPYFSSVNNRVQLLVGAKAPGATLAGSHGKQDQSRYLFGTTNLMRCVSGLSLLNGGEWRHSVCPFQPLLRMATPELLEKFILEDGASYKSRGEKTNAECKGGEGLKGFSNPNSNPSEAGAPSPSP